jgi:hypothetical protein
MHWQGGDMFGFNNSPKFCFATSEFITRLQGRISIEGGWKDACSWCDETIIANIFVQCIRCKTKSSNCWKYQGWCLCTPDKGTYN